MKTIIFLIILWQIVSVLKKVFEASVKQEQAEKDDKPTWQKKLVEVATKIKEEIETQNTHSNGKGQDSWERILSGGEKEKAPLEKKDGMVIPKSMDIIKKRQHVTPPGKKTEIQKATQPQTKMGPDKTDIQKSIDTDGRAMGQNKDFFSIAPRKKCSKSVHRFKGMKKAFVWKEILDKPVGLRED